MKLRAFRVGPVSIYGEGTDFLAFSQIDAGINVLVHAQGVANNPLVTIDAGSHPAGVTGEVHFKFFPNGEMPAHHYVAKSNAGAVKVELVKIDPIKLEEIKTE
jgi:hypothetical protein